MAITAAKILVEVDAETKNAEAGLKRVEGALRDFAGKNSQMGSVFGGVLGANMLMGAIQGVQQLGAQALTAYADFERLGMSLQALQARELLGSGAAANMGQALQMAAGPAQELIGWVEDLAVLSPFSEADVSQSMRLAQAYGFTTTEAKRLTTAVIDFAAGAGMSGASMSQIVLALGQIQAKGKLAGQEVLQLVNAGLGVDQILAKAFGKSTAEIVSLREQGLIPANLAIEAITRSLEQDFGGAAKRQSSTMAGLISSMEDLKSIGLREFFAGTFQTIQPYLEQLIGTFQSGQFQATLKAWGAALGDFVGQAIAGIKSLVDWWGSLDKSTQDNLLTAGQALVVFGGTAVVATNALGALAGAGAALIATGISPLIVSIGALVAVWATWNKEITQTNAAGVKATTDAWNQFFQDQIGSGTSATQMMNAYVDAHQRTQDALNSTNPFLRLFIDETGLQRQELTAVEAVMRSTTSSWSEYSALLGQAAVANGLMIDAEGNLVQAYLDEGNVRTRVIQANYELSASTYEALRTLALAGNSANDAGYGFRQAAEGATQAKDAMAGLGGSSPTLEGWSGASEVIRIFSQTLKESSLSSDAQAMALSGLNLTLGTTTPQVEALRYDVQLLSRGWEAGVVSQNLWQTGMLSAAQGVTALTADQRVAIQTELEQIGATKALADNTQKLADSSMNAAIQQMRLAETLKNATRSTIGKTAIDQLTGAFDNLPDAQKKLAFPAVMKGVQDLEIRYGLATPKSQAYAAGITDINDALLSGILPADQYTNAMDALTKQGVKFDLSSFLKNLDIQPAVQPGQRALTNMSEKTIPDYVDYVKENVPKTVSPVKSSSDGIIKAMDLQAQSIGNAKLEARGLANALKGIPDSFSRTYEITYIITTITNGSAPKNSGPPGVTAPPGVPVQTLANGANFIVPPGYNNDTYGPLYVSSGEHVQVTPAGQASTSGVTVNMSVQTMSTQLDMYRLATAVADEIRRRRL